MTKKLLIISYTFPPSNKVGGRRWAKFAKYLLRKNVDFKVLTSKNTDENGWVEDLEILKDRIDPISFNYPFYLGIVPNNLYEKIRYHLSLLFSKLKTDLNFYDKAVHGRKNLLSRTEYYIEKGYNNVIVTVAPFHLATHLCELIPKYPEVNFIVDFRDPWINNQTSYGYHSLSDSRKINEQISEKNVINSYNHVITVSESITNMLRKRYPESKTVFSTIPNGFDIDDIKYLKNDRREDDTIINLIFSGTLYDTAIENFEVFINLLVGLRREDEELYSSIRINFYGKFQLDDFKNPDIIKFNGVLSQNEINNEIFNSDACLLFLPDDMNYTFSTKFCEYVGRKKPIIVFSNEGLTSNFITNNKIGESFSRNSTVLDLIEKLKNIKYNKQNYYRKYNCDQFDIGKLSEKIYKLIN